MSKYLDPAKVAANDQAGAHMREQIFKAADMAIEDAGGHCDKPLCAGDRVVAEVVELFNEGGTDAVAGLCCAVLRLLGEARQEGRGR